DISRLTPSAQRLLAAIRGLVFLASPHAGADLASLSRYLAFFLRRTAAIEELTAHAPSLWDLNRWYQHNAPARGVRTRVYFETQPMPGVGIVVSATSANPGMPECEAIPLDANHTSICKPERRDGQLS